MNLQRIAELGEEGVRIICRPNMIIITGGRPRGTLYAVYEFFESLGVRFLTLKDTHIPEALKFIPQTMLNYTFVPPISWRYTYSNVLRQNPVFATRLRQNTMTEKEKFGGRHPHRLINHTVSGFLPWHKYGKEHPEYYAIHKGKRPTKVSKVYQTYQIHPCYE